MGYGISDFTAEVVLVEVLYGWRIELPVEFGEQVFFGEAGESRHDIKVATVAGVIGDRQPDEGRNKASVTAFGDEAYRLALCQFVGILRGFRHGCDEMVVGGGREGHQCF